jgi:choline dehydrogenase-like flavoprotein
MQADLCIVGAGAAGIALALQFLEGPFSVILLEAGGEEPASGTLYEGEVAQGSLHPPAHRFRQRRFGGTTGLWGGRCMPLDPIDFEKRDWIEGSGWPFGIGELLPFYAEANRLCEAGEFAYTAQAAFPRGMRPMLEGFRPQHFTDDTLERFSCPTDFGRRYKARLAASRTVRVVQHANVTAIRADPTCRHVQALDVATLGGRRFQVQARHVVLATGGLETPRLLLASNDVQQAGLGNGHDQVGRRYMCHMAGTIGSLRTRRAFHGYELSDDGVYCRRRLALTAASQRQLRTGSFIARLHHPRIPDPGHRTGALSALYLAAPFIAEEYRTRLLDGTGRAGRLAHIANVARDPAGAARFLAHWAWRRTLAERKFPSVIVTPRSGAYSLDFHAEQVPNPQSRITLSTARDELGMPRIVVDWRHSPQDIETVRRALRCLGAQLAASGCATLAYEEEAVETEVLRHGAYGGHHIGTARMAEDASQGVVDADCRVHGLDNLFIAGSAVFPTSGQANPTLTIVALALRLAARLREVLGAEVAPEGTASSFSPPLREIAQVAASDQEMAA